MANFGIKMELLSSLEQKTLSTLNIELFPSGIKFHRRLSWDQMRTVGQILMDLKYRTNDEDNHIHFAIGDWILQADDWFGKNIGIEEALQLKPTPHNSCFISYSHKDEKFIRRLYSRLRAANISVWYALEDIRGGEKIHEQIDRAIKGYDKLLIVLSDNSLHSEWIMTEIRKARKAESEENRRKLFPIRLVDIQTISEWECFDADMGKDLAVEIREYFIPDFSNWKNPDVFQRNFSKLLDDLKAT